MRNTRIVYDETKMFHYSLFIIDNKIIVRTVANRSAGGGVGVRTPSWT